VTGAGRGIGRAIALSFAEEGAELLLASRTINEIQSVADEILARKGIAIAIRADITDQNDVDKMVATAIARFKKIDVLVNSAGILGPIGLITETDLDLWAATIKANLIGTYLCCAAVLPYMIKAGRGKIINLSGGGATNPRPRFSAYAASKAAVVRLTETVAEEMKDFNIQVNAIAPGAVNTRMLDEILAAGRRAGKETLAKARKQKESGGTLLRLPCELAVFLASDESDGLTGRLISAVWDSWKDLPANLHHVMASDLYTLRRVVP